jgi:ubiquinone/menaquinone biosynthesis C-methylase UbiE
MSARRYLALLLALLAAGPIMARDGADPSINRPYLDPDFQQWVERFERPGREVYDRRQAIIAASGVKPGMRVADIGAGTGLFSMLFARQVGTEGKVYAVDISKTFIKNIEQRARHAGLTNITGITSTQSETRLPPDSVHLAFVCDTYHHFEQPRSMLASIHRALKSGGILVVIDFERIEGKSSDWVLGHVRAGKQQAIREIEAAGFRLMEDRPLLRENFYLKFGKNDLSKKP